MSSLPNQFVTFIENISLGERQVERIQSAATALADYLRSAMELEAEDGSYSGGVAAGGSQAPVVKSCSRTSRLVRPHLLVVER